MLLVGPRVIADAKIAYLLDPDHPVGGDKARFFMSFGFDPAEPDILAAALLRHASTRAIHGERERDGGVNREVRCQIATPDGRDPCVVAIWTQAAGEGVHRFVTAYPA